jgi:serine/threonine protein kinase
MAVRDRSRGHESQGRRVAVKFVMIELRAAERPGLLREVARNYTCGKGLAASGGFGCGSGEQEHTVHPNIIGFRGAIYVPTSRRLGIIMDWVDGPSLLQLYTAASFEGAGTTLGVGEFALHAIVVQSLHALIFMHARHLIHRDIKPSSILVRRDGQVLVTNLGNIRHLAKTHAQAASVVGTTCYFAVCCVDYPTSVLRFPNRNPVLYSQPERIVGSSFQTSVDIWALGVTLLEAATAVFPFKAQQDNYMALLEYIVTCTGVHCGAVQARARAWSCMYSDVYLQLLFVRKSRQHV